MHAVHPNARTTPAVRAEIARSAEPTGVLARRYGVSTETIRKRRQRGPADCRDRSARPHKLPWKASEDERAILCALRRATGFPLDDLTFVVTHFLPHLNRDAVYRILKAESLNRLPPSARSRKPHGVFKNYELGFVHLDVKHLPKLRDRNGLTRKRSLYVAIDRGSRWVHGAVKDDETTASAPAFLKEAIRAFPFQVTPGLTDRGSCFGADAFEAACRRLKVEHRTTRPSTPRTNGMGERFNGRVQREVLGITLHSPRDLEILLHGFNGPTMPDDSGCWAASRPTRWCDDGWRPSLAWPAGATSHRQTRASCPRPSSSSQPPSTSRIQTASPSAIVSARRSYP